MHGSIRIIIRCRQHVQSHCLALAGRLSLFHSFPLSLYLSFHCVLSAGSKLKLKTQSTYSGIAIMGAADMHIVCAANFPAFCMHILPHTAAVCRILCVCESKNMHMLAHRQPHKHLTARLANKHSIIAYFCASSSQNGVALFAPSQQELQSLLLFCPVLFFLFLHAALAPCSSGRTCFDVAYGNVIAEYFGEV